MAEKQRLSESDTIILSLHDRWWGKVLAGEKPLEIRKTRPAGKGSYRVLVYVTGTGEIKGEFVCKEFLKICHTLFCVNIYPVACPSKI